MNGIGALRVSEGLVDLARRMYRFCKKEGRHIRLRWPIYDVWRYHMNGESRKLYRRAGAQMAPRAVERRVIEDLRSDGISVVQLTDLLSAATLAEIKEWAEAALRGPAIAERIKAIESGQRPEAKGDKYYIVRPLGDLPVFSAEEAAVRMALSDTILRIVCGYFRMFCRLAALDLWYNVPVNGPDVFSQRWHRDPEDRKLLKIFLYLRDVDEGQGPFCYLPGTHSPGAFVQKIGRYNYPKDGIIDGLFPPSRRSVCTGKAGTLIFCDTTGFHKGGHATTGARLVLNAMYTSNGSQPLSHALYSLKGSDRGIQGSAARYAIDLLGDRRSMRSPFLHMQE